MPYLFDCFFAAIGPFIMGLFSREGQQLDVIADEEPRENVRPNMGLSFFTSAQAVWTNFFFARRPNTSQPPSNLFPWYY